ncbi:MULTISPECIES: hypothetical protein [unclassified Haladaptatus]|uniref:hypothetical protein n=1 Tax=unclassified Haladaptatus TaxID=2622732 RepID=UPI00209BE253|nr:MULTISPECIES: hypothetical protein [unclassified Haladaptatus]MCO8244296.1 hypothetical protein [Haladaptatus sp. AB643]MCO8254080.1 hypothetical protein [Haladaptatus sp. AB618]
MSADDDSAESNPDSFLDRFVHPRIAAIAIAGIALWGVSFLIAASGVAIEYTGKAILSAQLFFVSSLTGIVGILILGCCVLWLVGVRIRQVLSVSENS